MRIEIEAILEQMPDFVSSGNTPVHEWSNPFGEGELFLLVNDQKIPIKITQMTVNNDLNNIQPMGRMLGSHTWGEIQDEEQNHDEDGDDDFVEYDEDEDDMQYDEEGLTAELDEIDWEKEIGK